MSEGDLPDGEHWGRAERRRSSKWRTPGERLRGDSPDGGHQDKG